MAREVSNYHAFSDEDDFEEVDSYFCGCIPRMPNPAEQLTSDERIAMSAIKTSASMPFDSSNSDHEDLLSKYWRCAFKDEEPPKETTNSNWQRLGFQSGNPRTDFRGGGLLSLQQMIYLAEMHPRNFQMMIEDCNSERGYLLSACLINLTQLLVCFLRLDGGSQHHPVIGRKSAPRECIKTFARLANEQARPQHCFDELYAACAIRMHREWMRQWDPKAGEKNLLRFNHILGDVKKAVENLLKNSRIRLLSEFSYLYSEA
uniref:ELMO domain-containing protein n=1 Tax=Chromera velia CCMP2878 TaxID=1169474 RepID=A0A0G4HLX1_9ALVE|mmetsp:Transcript_42571/g.83926  ORF Transcript_42571/g.83926 Transcript_42571/m.83926 type:complete len:260 (+) Transcript_42571:140-919(+)|eukprot:Cvel_28924.t1-p1 / transcript=Cvel_28924.t1 / gene=Cvel_28924 / organism=Chromera_velia_CCMP2878 / gene_product=ELMO domain-containing protein 1, putative / transcript_product=ELMO domain-containing protein 1, putative / location=Cvel_scaffold3872:63-3013(-) / protein_length=259 / sequence_SO=supercontig / SO=protein_coding / is_pseudo=false